MREARHLRWALIHWKSVVEEGALADAAAGEVLLEELNKFQGLLVLLVFKHHSVFLNLFLRDLFFISLTGS